MQHERKGAYGEKSERGGGKCELAEGLRGLSPKGFVLVAAGCPSARQVIERAKRIGDEDEIARRAVEEYRWRSFSRKRP